MTEEIKILLDILNKVKDYDDKRYFISCGENDYLLTNDEIKALLNYITNLQKEKDNYKQRNEKAVKYIKNTTLYGFRSGKTLLTNYLNDLLNILESGDE